jgi:hypothetical protein
MSTEDKPKNYAVSFSDWPLDPNDNWPAFPDANARRIKDVFIQAGLKDVAAMVDFLQTDEGRRIGGIHFTIDPEGFKPVNGELTPEMLFRQTGLWIGNTRQSYLKGRTCLPPIEWLSQIADGISQGRIKPNERPSLILDNVLGAFVRTRQPGSERRDYIAIPIEDSPDGTNSPN